MEKRSREAVIRAIEKMHTHLGDQLTVDDLAKAAMFSKFHFCRVFQCVTGLPPGRFLSSLRLMEAKRLLYSTSLSVTQISTQVGYTSVGTFSSRFKAMVGDSPSYYRQRRGRNRSLGSSSPCPESTTVHGQIQAFDDSRITGIFIGIFPDPIIQGTPASAAVLSGAGTYTLTNVPYGRWHLMAHAVMARTADDRSAIGDQPHAVIACTNAFTLGNGPAEHVVDLELRQRQVTDPPVLLEFPGTRLATNTVERAS